MIDQNITACRNSRPCVLEWRRYRSANDILIPFGYTTDFTFRVLQPYLLNATKPAQFSVKCKKEETTYAVRGATVARTDHPSYLISTKKNMSQTARSSKMTSSSSSSDTDNMNANNDDEIETTKQMLLPRLIQRKIRAQIAQKLDSDNHKAGKKSRMHFRVHHAVQFLKSNGDRAVRMRTDPFACGLAAQPVTMFCAAISNEDGVFLSGLKQRFQLGHLYPKKDCVVEKLTDPMME